MMEVVLKVFKKKTDSYQTIPKQLLIGNCRYVVIDTELTGLDPKKDSIVSIGCIKMIGSKIELGQTFYKIVKPISVLTPKSVLVHGITPEETEISPSVEDVLSEFLSFCKDSIIVGHFLFIDIMFINKEMKRVYNHNIENYLVDTFKIYRWIKEHGDAGKHFHRENEDDNLFSIAKKYQIPISHTHNALIDAFITAQLFQRFLSFLPDIGVRTVKDLLKVGGLKKGR